MACCRRLISAPGMGFARRSARLPVRASAASTAESTAGSVWRTAISSAKGKVSAGCM